MIFPKTKSGSATAQSAKTAFTGADLLSIDVEDYFQVEAFAGQIQRSSWTRFASRVEQNTNRILELLSGYGYKATFFVLGWVAEHHPRVVRAIAEAGHEIGCHSHWHKRVFTLSPEEFREDLRRAKRAIEDACGQTPVGFRAPTFSIGKNCVWALEVLAEEGFLYDSSIFPIRHDLYGVPDAPRFSCKIPLSNGLSMVEVPPSTVRIAGVNLGAAGGGYLRHLPVVYTRWAMQQIHGEGQPVNVYFHPWEIDANQPRLQGSRKSMLRHYRGLDRMLPRLRLLCDSGRFEPVGEFVRRFIELESDRKSHRDPILALF